MVALLVAMSIMAVMMTVAMPVWKQTAQREKEEELVFRGKQYVHAIELYGRKFANTQPPSIDILVQQRFLRKKFKDPITNEDFQAVTANTAATAGGGAAGRAGIGTAQPGSTSPGPGFGTASQQPGRGGTSQIGTPGAGPVGGIVGVVSKSKGKSIRLYNGRGHYNEWVFLYQPQQQPGAGGRGVGVPGTTPRGGIGGNAPGGVPGRGGPARGGAGFPGGRGGPGAPGTGPAFPPSGGGGRGRG
jgi:type II secretory pathway pseudopilin PulG